MLAEIIRVILRRIHGERRSRQRYSAERVQVTERLYNAAVRLGQVTGQTPEELLDYRRADRILGGRR